MLYPFVQLSGTNIIELTKVLEPDLNLLIVFLGTGHDPATLYSTIKNLYPQITVVCCNSTAEISPQGVQMGTISALGVRSPARSACHLVKFADFDFERGVSIVKSLSQDLELNSFDLSSKKQILITCVNPCRMEEDILVSSLTYYSGLEVVGGSAGDDFKCVKVNVSLNGVFGEAVVILLEPNVPFYAFNNSYFIPTNKKLVVTSSNGRWVHEINGRPALDVLADILNIDRLALLTTSVENKGNLQNILHNTNVRLAIKYKEGYAVRSVLINDGASIMLGASVQDGSILTLMEAGELIQSTKLGIYEGVLGVERPKMLLTFCCCTHLLYATRHQLEDQFFQVFNSLIPAVGFFGFGEQHNIPINESVVMVVFGDILGRN